LGPLSGGFAALRPRLLSGVPSGPTAMTLRAEQFRKDVGKDKGYAPGYFPIGLSGRKKRSV